MEKKEAMKILKDFHDKSALFSVRTVLDVIIPELRESEDDRIRKEIIKFLELPHRQFVGERCQEEWIAWLEKQGEQKPYGQREECLDCQFNYAGECKSSCQMKRDEQKPVDKSEPKFKVGDWIIHQGTENIYQVVSRIDNQYQLKYGDNYTVQKYSDVDKNARLWDITKDAKDGDVLAVEPIDDYQFPFIAIYENRGLNFFNSYCSMGFDGKFYEATTGHALDNLYPATKEQRDLLSQKMREAGYGWDSEKKELKKLSQRVISAEAKEALYDKPTDEEMKELLRTEYEKGRADTIAEMEKEWSEEDEKMLEGIVNTVKDVRCQSLLSEIEIYDDYIDWLKSLKDRYTWKPSNEQIEALEHFVKSIGEGGYASPYDNNTKLLYSLLEQLKKLKA